MVSYEWDIETVADAASDAYAVGDVIDHEGADTYADACLTAEEPHGGAVSRVIALVRDDRHGRSWAYVKDGVLDAWCRSASGAPVVRTPQRFVLEVKRYEAGR